jgi:hypothetical protein
MLFNKLEIKLHAHRIIHLPLRRNRYKIVHIILMCHSLKHHDVQRIFWYLITVTEPRYPQTSCNIALLVKLIEGQWVKKFNAGSDITVFTRDRSLTLNWANWIRSKHHTIFQVYFNISPLSTSWVPKVSLSFRVSVLNLNLIFILRVFKACYILRPSYPP